jgi:hypothetical protein
MQAAGDAREDQREIGGAEAGFGEDRVGGGALADGGGEFAAVVDQLADQGEQAAAAAGLGRWGWDWGFGHGGHEHNKNTSGPRMSRNIFRRLRRGRAISSGQAHGLPRPTARYSRTQITLSSLATERLMSADRAQCRQRQRSRMPKAGKNRTQMNAG